MKLFLGKIRNRHGIVMGGMIAVKPSKMVCKIFYKVTILLLCLLCMSNADAQIRYDWTGAVSSDWSNHANWESTVSGVVTNPAASYPAPADTARVGVIAFSGGQNMPVISSGGATSVGSIVWGTENYLTISLVVNTSFTVNGSVNNTSAVPGNGSVSAYVFNLSGTGTLRVAGSLNIGYDDGFSTGTAGNNNTFTFNSSITQLTVVGNIVLNAFQGDTHHRGFLPSLNIQSGTVSAATISTTFSVNTANSAITANVAVGNSSGTPTAVLQLTGANALTTFSPYIINTLTFNNPGATVEYAGTGAQTVYTDNPISGLNNTIKYNSIKFSGSGVKTALSGNLYVAGDFTNTMTNDSVNYVSLSAPTVNFNGTTQNLYGGSGNGTTFYNVAFSNSGTKTMSSGSFKVAGTGVLTMSGTAQLAAGSGLLTLLSTSSSTATVAAIPAASSITGTVNVQRYISGGSNAYRGYRFLSSPVYTVKSGSNYYYDLSYLPLYAPITGTLGTSGGLSKTGNPSVYFFRDDQPFSNTTFNTYNYRGINKINNSPLYSIGVDYDGTFNLHVGTGFLFFYRGDLSNISTKYLTTTSAESTIFVSTGVLNQQAITVTNWYTQLATLQYSNVSGNSATKGFNLVGNPYASSINWNTYSTTNSAAGIYAPHVSNTIYIYNEVSKVYATYSGGIGVNGASNIIPSGQGFFVRADTTGASLTFNEAAKTNTQLSGPTQATGTTLLLSTGPVASDVPQYLRIELAQDLLNKEEAVIVFDNLAKNIYQKNEDSPHFPGSGSVSFSSISDDNIALAIDRRPLPNKSQNIRLSVNATADGIYKLNMTEIKAIPKLFDIWLMDAYRKDSLDIRHNPTYTFNLIKSDTNSCGSNRFSLVIRQNAALGVHLLDFTAARASGGVQVRWKTENEENYTYFTVERSTDNGSTFNPIGGFTSSAQGNYGLLDANPLIAAGATDQYRLRLQDLNGTIIYSKIVTLGYVAFSASLAYNPVTVYPNPASATININIAEGQLSRTKPSNLLLNSPAIITTPASSNSQSYQIRIVNSMGVVVKTATSAQPNWQHDVSSLQPGTYFIQVINNADKSLVGRAEFAKL